MLFELSRLNRVESTFDVQGRYRAMLFQRKHIFSVRAQAAFNPDAFCRSPGLDAECGGGQLRDDAFHERVADCPECLNSSSEDQRSNGLANLDSHRPVGVSDDPVELGSVHGSCVHIESSCALTEGFDRCFDHQFSDGSKIHDAHAARPEGGDFLPARPAIDAAPIVEGHIIRAIGSDLPRALNEIDARTE